MRLWHILCLAAVSGCQAGPPSAPLCGPPPPEAIRLFGHEIAPDLEAVTHEVLVQVSPGMDFDRARATLEANGFECRGAHTISELWSPLAPPEVSNEVAGSPFWRQHLRAQSIYCVIRRDELSRWGREYKTILVLLYPDQEKKRLDHVLVFVGTGQNPKQSFFEKHPELREPVGQPLAEAQRQMVDAGFKCATGKTAAGSAFLSCRYYDEWAIGGKIIRINLYCDDSGTVRDSEVVRDREWFEMERCMLPDRDDSTWRMVGKSALFPVREACLLTAEGAVWGVSLTLVGLCSPGLR